MDNTKLTQLVKEGQAARQQGQWAAVEQYAMALQEEFPEEAEGYFLEGLVQNAAQRPALAFKAFAQALEANSERHDAGIELAYSCLNTKRYGEAYALVQKYSTYLDNSPRYLDMAGTVMSTIGLPEAAWPLYEKANALQPGVDLFDANRASCAVFIGKIDEAREIYTHLLSKYPAHQRNHYYLSRLGKAKDDSHVTKMKEVLTKANLKPEQNVFLYYALGKQLEDLERWDEAFHYYKQGGDAITSVANYSIDTDIGIADGIINCCTREWLSDKHAVTDWKHSKTPIFIVGLPRTGTTLTERIVASHSQVSSLGETEFIEFLMRRESGVVTPARMDTQIIDALKDFDMQRLSDNYMDSVSYRFDESPLFIDKLPYNFLYLGYIAKAFPTAKIVHLKRHPMDSCFAMYKQVFTWAYKFSYHQKSLAQYYLAYDRLMNHWRDVLGDRLIEVEYESLVGEIDTHTRTLLSNLDLEFEEACLNFDKNKSASTTASSVQVREKAHTRSVGKWRRFEAQLEPLAAHLREAGIKLD